MIEFCGPITRVESPGFRCRSCGGPATGSLDILYVNEDESRRKVAVPICVACAYKGFSGERVEIRIDESESPNA